MQLLIGLIFIILSFLGGFLLSGGNAHALWQPWEIFMLVGSGASFLFASNSFSTVKKIALYAKYCFKPIYDKEKFENVITLMFLLSKVFKEDVMKATTHLEAPHESSIFTRFPKVLSDKWAVDFICNNFLLYSDNLHDLTAFAFEEYMDNEIEKYECEAEGPYKAMSAMVETYPALGICAAVLGIILSMAYLSADMSVLGHHIGSALFGTFFGIFLAYGVFKPISLKFHEIVEDSVQFMIVPKVFLVSLMKGYEPLLAAAIANKMVPPHHRTADHLLKKILMTEKM